MDDDDDLLQRAADRFAEEFFSEFLSDSPGESCDACESGCSSMDVDDCGKLSFLARFFLSARCLTFRAHLKQCHQWFCLARIFERGGGGGGINSFLVIWFFS